MVNIEIVNDPHGSTDGTRTQPYNDDCVAALKLIVEILFGDMSDAYNDMFINQKVVKPMLST